MTELVNLTLDAARIHLFAAKGRTMEHIPSTRDTLELHIRRARYQGAFCWGQTLITVMNLPEPSDWGWSREKGTFGNPSGPICIKLVLPAGNYSRVAARKDVKGPVNVAKQH